jgi:hypothetical protein
MPIIHPKQTDQSNDIDRLKGLAGLQSDNIPHQASNRGFNASYHERSNNDLQPSELRKKEDKRINPNQTDIELIRHESTNDALQLNHLNTSEKSALQANQSKDAFINKQLEKPNPRERKDESGKDSHQIPYIHLCAQQQESSQGSVLLDQNHPRATLVYFHGNAEDLIDIYILLEFLHNQHDVADGYFQFDVVAIEYPSYSYYKANGRSANELTITEDAERFMRYLIFKKCIPIESIVVVGIFQ